MPTPHDVVFSTPVPLRISQFNDDWYVSCVDKQSNELA